MWTITTKTVKGKTPSLRKLDLSWYEDANSNGFAMIREDPVLNGRLSLDEINKDIEDIYSAISYTPVAIKFPSLARLPIVGPMLSYSAGNKMTSFEWKLSNVFVAYDDNYQLLQKSGKLYVTQINIIDKKLTALKKHHKTIPTKTDNQKLYKHWVNNLIKALEGTQTRMNINLETASDIKVQMELNRPLFKEIIDCLVIEKAWEVGLKAAINSIDVMNKFIIKASWQATDSTIALNRDINQKKYSTLMSDAFIANLNKLSDAMKETAELKTQAIKAYDESNKKLSY